MIVADKAGKILSYNRRFLEMWRISEELAQAGIDDAVMRAGAKQIKDPDQFVARVIELYRHPEEIEHAEIEFKDGRVFDRHTQSFRLANGDYIGRIWFFLDVTERKRLDEALRQSQERLTLATESAGIGIWDLDVTTNKLVWDERMYALYGIRAQDFSGAYDAWQAGLHPEDRVRRDVAINAAIDRVKDFNIEFRVLWPNGETHTIEAHALVQGPANGRATRMVGVNWDITERKQAEERITRMARHDVLTGLANRGVFVEALQLAVARARRGSGSFAVLYLDLDHFKDVNDTLGHPVGDLLLCAVSERLSASIRETDLVARFGGDEFAVLQTDIREPEEAGAFAEKLLKAISEPYVLGDTKVRSGGSAGIAVFGTDSPDAETLLSNADVALYRAKSEGRGTYRFFTDAMNLEVHTRVNLATELREAIAAGQLFLEYQPQVDVDTGRIVGVEALARWHHPTRGVVSPGEFIPAAEKSGLIAPLGHWVLREACRQMKEWLDADLAPPLVGVNLSALQFKAPLDLENDIAAILAEMALPPQRLELELTESALMEASREHNDVLLRLRKTGIQIAIDDFGNGYSSLAYLSRFPVDRIKIAQNFLLDLPAMPRNRAIVRAAIRLAHELDLLIVVEGVETAAQLNLIRSWSAHQVQGFYFSRPLSASEMTALLGVGKIVPAVAGAAGVPVPV
jgi:diguanylate cyclase (GGDEF)-like protein/PAS domain S-box-containing protein